MLLKAGTNYIQSLNKCMRSFRIFDRRGYAVAGEKTVDVDQIEEMGLTIKGSLYANL